MRRIPIRLKLVGALAVPLFCLLTVIVAQVLDTSREVAQVKEQTGMATASIGPSGLMSGLQDERNWASVYLIGQEGVVTLRVSGYEETRANTDKAIAEFKRVITAEGGAVADAYAPALAALPELEALRADIDANQGPRTLDANTNFAEEMFNRYAALIDPFHDGNTRLALAIDDPSLRAGVELIDVTSRQIETVASLLRDVIQGFLDNGIEREDIATIAAAADDFRRYARAIDEGDEPFITDADRTVLNDFATEVLATTDAAVVGNVDINAVLAVADVPLENSYNGTRDVISRRLVDEADKLTSSADQRVGVLRAVAAIAVVAAALATWLVSKSITGPLHALTRQATDMANHRLPEAVVGILETPLGDDVSVPQVESVSVDTRDEVGDVAHALNTVQDSALSLAVEQAVLRRNIADSFVNLGRRNQNLLSRQLNFITELEANETDPDTLSNLFRLDHLATRMRRNAESLLLLAGVDPPRTWSGPVRINDVIRAALGEVEDYQRVVDRGVEPAMVLGIAAADLAHLLAELIDNALIYSPPDQAVEVRGGRRSHVDGGGYTLAVVDAGLGMRPDELTRANRRLAGAESFTIAPSKYLGHYVAGHLAARHNITVTLHTSQGGGITAVLELPTTLLIDNHTALPQNAPALPY